MATCLFLLVAVVLAFAGGAGPWITIATVVIATVAGTRLPDLDIPLGFRHRSALLHGVLPPLLALLDRRTWPVAAGLGFGIGLHLAADMFPREMRGYATIKLPLLGSIGVLPSYLWIAANAAATLIGGAMVLGQIADRQAAAATMAAVGVVGFLYLLRADGGWYALAVFAMLGWLMLG